MELLRFAGVESACDHGFEDGFEEAGVFAEGGAVAFCKGAFDGACGCRGDQFEAADEDARGLYRRGLDAQRQHGIHEFRRNDVEEAAAFLKPGIAPGFDHGLRLVLIEALGDENSFEVAREGVDTGGELRRVEARFGLQYTGYAIADSFTAPLEENDGRE